VLLVPDLSARITLLDKNDQVITHLGEDPAWREQVLKDNMKMRSDPKGEGWVSGKFLHPHDACFDPAGNIFVAEWVHTGRVTKLRKVTWTEGWAFSQVSNPPTRIDPSLIDDSWETDSGIGVSVPTQLQQFTSFQPGDCRSDFVGSRADHRPFVCWQHQNSQLLTDEVLLVFQVLIRSDEQVELLLGLGSLLGILEHRDRLLSSYVRETIEIFIETESSFQIRE